MAWRNRATVGQCLRKLLGIAAAAAHDRQGILRSLWPQQEAMAKLFHPGHHEQHAISLELWAQAACPRPLGHTSRGNRV